MQAIPFIAIARLYTASSVFTRRLEYLTLTRQDEQIAANAATFTVKSSLESRNSSSLYTQWTGSKYTQLFVITLDSQ